jgi:hypothetical protein
MATIILRQSNVVTSTGGTVKGSPLTNAEVDNNFANLNVVVNGLTSNVANITYPVGSSGNVLTSNGTFWLSQGLPASGLSYVAKSANYTIQNNEGVLSNTALGSFTITLPSSPSIGNQVVVADSFNFWSSNNLFINRNGSTIENLAEDLVCDIKGASLQLVYTGNTWDVFATTGVIGGTALTLDAVQSLSNKTLVSATLTGTTQAVTAANGTSNAMVATTEFVNNEINDSPTITNATLIGTPQAVTAANGTSNSMVATTAFVNNEIADSPIINTPTINTPTINTATINTPTINLPTINYAQLNNPTLVSAFELANVRNEAPPAIVNIDMLDRNGSLIFFTSNTTANITVNLRGNASTSLDAWLGTTASNANVATAVMLVIHGTTQYYVNNVLIDGRIMHNSSIKGNLFWQGNTLSSGGTGTAMDSYGFTVIKNGGTRGGSSYSGNVFTILGSQSSFKSFLA